MSQLVAFRESFVTRESNDFHGSEFVTVGTYPPSPNCCGVFHCMTTVNNRATFAQTDGTR